MGFLEKLFGGGKKYPPLGMETPAAKKLEAMKEYIEEITKEVSDPLEVVPADDTAFVFIGNPNKNFGMAWVDHGKIQNFKTLAEEKGVPQQQLILMHKKLQDAYHRSGDDKRYSATIAGKDIVVTPSHDLAREVKEIIGNA